MSSAAVLCARPSSEQGWAVSHRALWGKGNPIPHQDLPQSSPGLISLSASVPLCPWPLTLPSLPPQLRYSRACAFGFFKVPDLLNLLTPRNLLLPLGPQRTRRKGCQKPFVESTQPLKEESKSTQPSLPLEWGCAKSGAFQIRHRRCLDSKAVSVDYSTGTGWAQGTRATSSSPALGGAPSGAPGPHPALQQQQETVQFP